MTLGFDTFKDVELSLKQIECQNFKLITLNIKKARIN